MKVLIFLFLAIIMMACSEGGEVKSAGEVVIQGANVENSTQLDTLHHN